MPTLANMHSRIARATAFQNSDDDIYSALDEAGFLVYTKVLKENRGFFVKTDTTTIALVPNTQIYSLPADATQILHLAEQLPGEVDWHPMVAVGLGRSLADQDDIYDYFVDDDVYGIGSAFQYWPFLSATNTVDTPDVSNADQVQQIQVSPLIDQARNCEIVYAAKWLPILDGSSALMLPEEGTYAMVNGALAILTGDTDDTREGSYASRAKTHLDAFLTWVRDRQMQTGPRVKPYLS